MGAPVTAPPALLLCGGRGTRLGGNREKPLVPVDGVAMVLRVLRAIASSHVAEIRAVVSPHAPKTADLLRDRAVDPRDRANESWERGSEVQDRAIDVDDADLQIHEGTGAGYVADLDAALDEVGTPAVAVAADLPLLTAEHVDDAIGTADGDSLAVCVPAALKRELGVSVDTTFQHEGRRVAPAGLNVVGDGDDRVVVRDDPALAVNVNRPRDLDLARERAAER